MQIKLYTFFSNFLQKIQIFMLKHVASISKVSVKKYQYQEFQLIFTYTSTDPYAVLSPLHFIVVHEAPTHEF